MHGHAAYTNTQMCGHSYILYTPTHAKKASKNDRNLVSQVIVRQSGHEDSLLALKKNRCKKIMAGFFFSFDVSQFHPKTIHVHPQK